MQTEAFTSFWLSGYLFEGDQKTKASLSQVSVVS